MFYELRGDEAAPVAVLHPLRIRGLFTGTSCTSVRYWHRSVMVCVCVWVCYNKNVCELLSLHKIHKKMLSFLEKSPVNAESIHLPSDLKLGFGNTAARTCCQSNSTTRPTLLWLGNTHSLWFSLMAKRTGSLNPVSSLVLTLAQH